MQSSEGQANQGQACPLCRSREASKLYDMGQAEGKAFQTCRCRACQFVYLWPRPSEAFLRDYYNDAGVHSYNSDVAADYNNQIRDKIALVTDLGRRFPQLPRAGKAVDFGAGHGATVKAWSDAGFAATGMEISAPARLAAHALFGVTVVDGTLDDLAPGSLALLTMFDVLEHMPEPVDSVRSLHKALMDGGACLMVVPNYDSFDRMVRGKASKALIFPEHVNMFTAKTLRRLFADHGFDVLYVGSPPPYGVAISIGLRRNLIKWFGRNPFVLGMGTALTWIKRYIVYPLPNAFVERSGYLGQSLLIVAAKASR